MVVTTPAQIQSTLVTVVTQHRVNHSTIMTKPLQDLMVTVVMATLLHLLFDKISSMIIKITALDTECRGPLIEWYPFQKGPLGPVEK